MLSASSGFAPRTGTMESGGWTPRELRRIVRGLEGLNFVSVCPIFAGTLSAYWLAVKDFAHGSRLARCMIPHHRSASIWSRYHRAMTMRKSPHMQHLTLSSRYALVAMLTEHRCCLRSPADVNRCTSASQFVNLLAKGRSHTSPPPLPNTRLLTAILRNLPLSVLGTSCNQRRKQSCSQKVAS